MSYFGLYLLDPKRQPWENPNCIGCIMSLYISLKFYNSDIIAFDVIYVFLPVILDPYIRGTLSNTNELQQPGTCISFSGISSL